MAMPIKRFVDLSLAIVLTVLTAPLLLMVVVLVKLTSAGPVIYSQTRLGLGRRPFTIYKVRSMYHDCERLSGPKWSTDNDPRVTAVGKILRRTHLDELPQLWNVLRGDMSLVGPRPERPEIITRLETVIVRYHERLNILPGVTGLAQLNLPPDTDTESVRHKLAYDLYYAQRGGLWLDLRIILSTGLLLVGMPSSISARMLGLCPPMLDIDAVEVVSTSTASRPRSFETAAIGVE
jgi:lipopolysaccharide/colanic/teichoic acid biosynthesis glycosyltransferase